jgi:hypothetical protein
MRHPKMSYLALPALLLLATGCSAVEDTARDIASGAGQSAQDAASNAVSQAAGAGRDALVRQACAPVNDGTIDPGDVTLLTGLLGAARAAGVPSEVLDPMEEIAAAGDNAPEDAVESLRDACADTGSQK